MTNTNRVFRAFKKIALTFSGLAASASLLADPAGNTRFDISDVNWQRIVLLGSLDSIAATATTSITFSLLTTNKLGNTGATTDLAAVKADGSTAVAINRTATGTFGTSTGKIASTGATASNIGSNISILATPDASVTAAAGSIDLYIEGQ